MHRENMSTRPFPFRGVARRGLCVVILGVSGFLGCGGGQAGTELVPVRGILTLKKSPIAGATILFEGVATDGANRVVQAETDAEGRFELKTHLGKGKYATGIAPGSYRVAATKLDASQTEGMTKPPKELFPSKYTQPATSGWTAEIGAQGADALTFDAS